MNMSSRGRTAGMLIFLILVWGVNWPLSKLALNYAPPLLFAGIRTIIGGILLILIALPRYKQLRFKENWAVYLVSALVNIVLFYGLQTVGLGYIPSGLFSAIVFLQPVLLGLLSWIWFGEAMYGLKVLGLILGFAGVTTISAGALSAHVSMIGILFALGTAISWALGTAFIKNIGSRVDAIWLVAIQLTMGGILLTTAGSATEAWGSIHWNGVFLTNLLFISIFVIAFGWLAYFTLIGEGEASKVASFTFLIPVVSITASSLFMREHITLNLVIGLLMILFSILFVNLKPKSIAANQA
ncbi:DMT family transporter [Paenibacillus rigui]|uniref:EamA domain-containing protein n=1 Tax=Paenibacillus rigui TaxID=554312 RepID=A0A229UG90_9BACL|nr:DMT family transporter [Paenibacillus rigui]OXM82413.1 hypothetical protein CF651_31130 [Paenibacillus rigui]